VIVLAAALVGALAVPVAAADPPKSFKIERIADIDYCDIPNDPDRQQHRLDVFRPVGKDECPVVFFIHGGGWMIGDKDDVLASTVRDQWPRPSPDAAWWWFCPTTGCRPRPSIPTTSRTWLAPSPGPHRNIAKYGGRPDQVFACGHSAGGHLVSLLATDETYLKAEGLSTKDIQGVVSISGIYRWTL